MNGAVVHYLDYSFNNKYLAVSTDQGNITIFDVKKKTQVVKIPEENCKAAYTCVKWRKKMTRDKTNNILIGTRSDGIIDGFHLNTKKRIFSIDEKIDGDVQINNFDYNPYYNSIAVVGAYPSVRLYDLETQKRKVNLDGKGCLIPGHTNRVFAVKILNDNNTVITSGWDQRIIWWDLRSEQPIESLFGSQIYGDSLDVCDGLLLSCNHRENAQIQL